jgi:hypothetical protein
VGRHEKVDPFSMIVGGYQLSNCLDFQGSCYIIKEGYMDLSCVIAGNKVYNVTVVTS